MPIDLQDILIPEIDGKNVPDPGEVWNLSVILSGKFRDDKAAVGRQMKSGPILGTQF